MKCFNHLYKFVVSIGCLKGNFEILAIWYVIFSTAVLSLVVNRKVKQYDEERTFMEFIIEQ